jgi:microcystin degradation protein MlrC
MRVAVAGFSHESNTFASQPTTLADFSIHFGDQFLDRHADTYHEIAGYIAAAADEGMQLLPILSANATPAGTVTAAAYDEITGQILSGLSELGPVDGVLLALHGAMVVEGIPHGDAETVRRVRAQLGEDVAIVVTHDYHANVPPELIENADALVIYKTNPHIDQRECGMQAATILARTIRGEIRPTMHLVKPEVVFNIYFHNTSAPPMQPLMQDAIRLEQQSGIVATSIAAGYQYADVDWMGPSVVVVTDGNKDLAVTEAERIGEAIWAIRQQLILDIPTPAKAVEEAIASDRRPTTLLDFGDNIGGGAAGDSTFVLEQFLEQEADGWVVTIWDPAAAQQCAEAGIGGAVALTVGGKTDSEHGSPLRIEGFVRTLSDGAYEEFERRHGGARCYKQGLTAVVRVPCGAGSGLLVLNSSRESPNSIHQITSVGIVPPQQKILAAKGAIAPRAAYEPVSPHLIEVDSGGACWIGRGSGSYERARKHLYEWTISPKAGDNT